MALTRAVVGGKVAAGTVNAIIDQVEEIGRHAEFTCTSANTATTTTASPGMPVIDPLKSNHSAFVVPGPGTLTIVDEGIYSIDVLGSIPVSPTGNTFIRVADTASQQGYNYGNINSGSWGGALVSNYYCAAGTVLTFQWFHTSAASRILTARIKVTRIA